MFKNKRDQRFYYLQDSEVEPGQAWDITPDGKVTVDVHLLLKRPKVQLHIKKARKVMERVRTKQQGSGQ
ncbi:MAG: hypothetical protein OXU29_06125 [Gammaproteobacteria bacterium]|nr:hypothetical protein [Gammaproteobacteria bacterium]